MNAADLAAQMAKAEVGGDYVYLNRKHGRYKLEVQSVKITDKGKPCLELKVVEAEKTQATEPHRVGEVVSYIEDVTDERKGGSSRMLRALLAIRDMAPSEIEKFEIKTDKGTRELEGKNAKIQWLIKFLDQTKQPCSFLPVFCEVEPRVVAASDKGPGGTFSKERWSTCKLDEAGCDAVDAKRAEAKLPSLEESMK